MSRKWTSLDFQNNEPSAAFPIDYCDLTDSRHISVGIIRFSGQPTRHVVAMAGKPSPSWVSKKYLPAARLNRIGSERLVDGSCFGQDVNDTVRARKRRFDHVLEKCGGDIYAAK